MISLRCSSLDRVAACSASAVRPAVAIDIPSEAADMGSAVHEVLSARVDRKDVDLAEVAARWDVDLPELTKLVSIAWAGWQRIAQHFADPVTELELTPLNWNAAELTGHADMLSISDDRSTIYGLDWKSGWADTDHEQQMRGYALLALCEFSGAEKVVWVVFKLRIGVIETYEWTRAELVEWWKRLVERTTTRLEVYSPSPAACGYCPRFAECPARLQMIQASVEQVAVADAPIVEHLTPAGLIRLHERAKVVAKCAEMALDAVRATVIHAGGSIEAPDGRQLVINRTVRTEIDYAAGEGVLGAHLGSRVVEAITVSKSKAEEIIRDGAARGKKKEAVEAFLYELDLASALKLSTVERLEVKKAPKAITTKG